MKKILYILDKLAPGKGGTATSLIELIRGLDKNEFEPMVCAICGEDQGPHIDELKSIGIEPLCLNLQNIYGPRAITAFLELVGVMRSKRVDVVHTLLFSSNIYGIFAAFFAGVHVRISAKREIEDWKRWHHVMLNKISNLLCSKVVANSEAVREFAMKQERITPEKIVTIYNGIGLANDVGAASGRENSSLSPSETAPTLEKVCSRPEAAPTLGSDGIVVGCVANLIPIKGHRYLIEAMVDVVKHRTDAKLLLVGDGYLRSSLEEYAENLGIKDNVVFAGRQKDVSSYLNMMDIYVSSSISEGFSNSILEAMAHRLPVVATDVGGNPEAVIDNDTGLLVKPQDSAAMVKGIIKLIDDKDLREKMGKSGYEVIKSKFTSEKMVGEYQELYTRLVNIRGREAAPTFGEAISRPEAAPTFGDAISRPEAAPTSGEIAFILSQFPETHETFILREFKAMRDAGMRFKIFSLKPCKDEVIHDDARPFMNDTDYEPFFLSLKVILANIISFISNPFKYINILSEVLLASINDFKSLWQSAAIFPKSVYYASVARKQKIKHIHAHWANIPSTSAYIASRFSGIPYGITAHAFDIFVETPMLGEKFERAKFIVTCTDYNRRHLIRRFRLNEDKVFLNYHGLEKRWFQREAQDSRVRDPKGGCGYPARFIKLLSIGRLVEQKGFEYLIKACAILQIKNINFSLKIIGDGPLRDEINMLVAEYNLQRRVEIIKTSAQEQVINYYKESDLFVLPCVISKNQDRDGIPNVILEAMAMGLPVIGTAVSGLPEVLRNEETALVVNDQDPDSLAHAIERVAHSNELGQKLAENGYKLVAKRFDLDENVENLKDIFVKNIIKKRIAYVVWQLEPWGAERVVINLAKNIDRSKFEPYVICINEAGSVSDELNDAGIPVITVNKRSKVDIIALFRLIRIFSKYNFDIIHTHMFTSNLWGRIANIFAGKKPLAITEHNVDEWKGKIELTLDKILLPCTDKLICVSEKVKSFYDSKLSLRNGKSVVCHNGVDVTGLSISSDRESFREKLGLFGDKKLIAVIGRLVPQKDVGNFLRAFKQICQKRKDVEALIVGDGPLREDLVKVRDELGLKEDVRFLGLRDDIGDILNAIDLLVVPSTREGLSVAILEAMAIGLPVVATDVGGNSECISDGVNGRLVPASDSKALADAIDGLMGEGEDSLRIMREASREMFIGKFTIDKMVKEHERIYCELSFPRKRESRQNGIWIPLKFIPTKVGMGMTKNVAGMTKRENVSDGEKNNISRPEAAPTLGKICSRPEGPCLPAGRAPTLGNDGGIKT
ncbi:glycosyltransferase [Candidatus Omnitrophota bacterium]